MLPGTRSLSGTKRRVLLLIVDVPLTMVFMMLSLTSSIAPLSAMVSSNAIMISVVFSADVPSAGVSESSEGGKVSGADDVLKGKVKTFSSLRPMISSTVVVTTIVYCSFGKKYSLGIILTRLLLVVKLAATE